MHLASEFYVVKAGLTKLSCQLREPDSREASATAILAHASKPHLREKCNLALNSRDSYSITAGLPCQSPQTTSLLVFWPYFRQPTVEMYIVYSDISSPYAHCPNTPQLARQPRIALTGRCVDTDASATLVSTMNVLSLYTLLMLITKWKICRLTLNRHRVSFLIEYLRYVRFFSGLLKSELDNFAFSSSYGCPGRI